MNKKLFVKRLPSKKSCKECSERKRGYCDGFNGRESAPMTTKAGRWTPEYNAVTRYAAAYINGYIDGKKRRQLTTNY